MKMKFLTNRKTDWLASKIDSTHLGLGAAARSKRNFDTNQLTTLVTVTN
jgi:hypothetical protein